jgi:hypothetical protein
MHQRWLPFKKDFSLRNHPRYLNVESLSKLGLNEDDAANISLRISVLLQHGKYYNALKLIANIEMNKCKESTFLTVYKPLLQCNISDCLISVRILNLLDSVGIRTWGDVANISPALLEKSIKNWGPECTNALQTAFKKEIAKRQEVLNSIVY